jgi:hypothetical protein
MSVFGNDGWDVIADYSDNAAIGSLVASLDGLVGELETALGA